METSLTKTRWFWPWQDEKEEAWLGEMSTEGWHLRSVALMGRYSFETGDARLYTYRLDYIMLNKDKRAEYLQIFQDAGWEYIGEMSNWQYWRKPAVAGETPEIFTDNDSKIKKYQRLLLYLAFMLILLVILGRSLFTGSQAFADVSSVITMIYFFGQLLYAILIPIYIVIVVKLILRINQLKKKVI
jgi:hypothetical protein